MVVLSAERETGAKNERHLVAVSCAKESGFEVVHGLLNRVMEVLGVPYKGGSPAGLLAAGWWRGSADTAAEAAAEPGAAHSR